MDTMLRLENAIQRLEAAIKRQEELHETTREQIVLLNKMLAVTFGLRNPTAEDIEDITKSNGLTGPVILDISKSNFPYYWDEADQTISLAKARQQSQASNGGNKSSQEEEEPKSNEDIEASRQHIRNILKERYCPKGFATSASEKSDSDTKGHEQ